MKELKVIDTEIKRLFIQLKELRIKKKQIEEQIIQYLEDKDQPGLKYEDLLVLSAKSKRRERKTKEDKESDILQILEQKGIRNSRETYSEIMDALKGREMVTPVLKIKNQVD
jgi:hypothetical protein